MITAAEVTSMRADLERTLTDTCTLRTAVQTVDALGTPTTTYTTSSVACRVGKLDRDAARYFSERLHTEVGARFTLPATVTPGPADEIAYGGKNYRIVIADSTPTTTRLCTVVQAVAL